MKSLYKTLIARLGTLLGAAGIGLTAGQIEALEMGGIMIFGVAVDLVAQKVAGGVE